MEEQGGGPQEMAFVRAAAGWFQAKSRGRACAGSPPTQASLRATGPTLEISGGVHREPWLGPGTWKPSLHCTGQRVFPRTILFRRSHTPAEAVCPGKTWAPGAGTGGQPRFHTRWRWTGQAGHRPLEVFSPGDSVLGPRRWLRVFLGLQLPHPCPSRPTRTERLQFSKVWAKLRPKGA